MLKYQELVTRLSRLNNPLVEAILRLYSYTVDAAVSQGDRDQEMLLRMVEELVVYLDNTQNVAHGLAISQPIVIKLEDKNVPTLPDDGSIRNPRVCPGCRRLVSVSEVSVPNVEGSEE